MKRIITPVAVLFFLALTACDPSAHATDGTKTDAAKKDDKAPTTQQVSMTPPNSKNVERTDKVVKTDEEWKKILTPEQYAVLRRKGTERPCSGEFWDNHDKGVYQCAGCGLELFGSGEKFESGTGWPSYFNPLGPDRIHIVPDHSHGMVRDEVTCARCGGHLGHVFNDGPPPTGLRFCINSISMTFEKKDDFSATQPAAKAK